jgi:hypothetical protein
MVGELKQGAIVKRHSRLKQRTFSIARTSGRGIVPRRHYRDRLHASRFVHF